MQIRITANPYALGNGHFPVGQVLEVERETDHYFILAGQGSRLNKKHMALTGWAGRYALTITAEIVTSADAADPLADQYNAEIVIEFDAEKENAPGLVREMREALAPLEVVISDTVAPISPAVARILALLPAGVAVRDTLEALTNDNIFYALTAYPLGHLDAEPGTPPPLPQASGADLVLVSMPGTWNGEIIDWGSVDRILLGVGDDPLFDGWQIVRNDRAPYPLTLVIAYPGRDVDPTTRDAHDRMILEALDSAYPGEPKPVAIDDADDLEQAEARPYFAQIHVSVNWNAQLVERDRLGLWLRDCLSNTFAAVEFKLAPGHGSPSSGNTFNVALSGGKPGQPGNKVAIESAILAYLDDRYPAHKSTTATALSIAIPTHWNGAKIDRAAVMRWCHERSNDVRRYTLDGSSYADREPVFTWIAGAKPDEAEIRKARRRLGAWLGNEYPAQEEAPGLPAAKRMEGKQ